MFTPILNLGPQWVAPSHQGFQFDATGEQILKSAGIEPGVIDGLSLNPLSKEMQFVDDPLAGQIAFRPREISPTYEPFWISSGNTGARKWILLPSESEAKQREVSRAGLTVQFDDLLKKAGITADYFRGIRFAHQGLLNAGKKAEAAQFLRDQLSKLSETERGRASGYAFLLDQLGRDGVSFLEEVPNLFDSGESGIRWNLAVPNVDVAVASSWTCEADQRQTFRIQRLNLAPGQIRSQFEIRIGNGVTLFALALTEGEGIEFRHYRNATRNYSLDERVSDEAEWQRLALRAKGDLTGEEKQQIEAWNREIAAIKKEFGTGGNKPTGEAAAKIEGIKKQIADLKKRKMMTDAHRARYNVLTKRIFIAREKVTLQEDSKSLFDKIVDVTLGFHRKGYISIRVGTGAKPGSEPFIYQIEGIAKTGKAGNILPDGSRILLKSNGGVWGAIHGLTDSPDVARLYSQPFSIPFPFDPAEWTVTLDAIGQDPDEADPSQPLTVLPRARVVGRVEEVASQTQYANHTGPARFRVCLDFFCTPDPKTGARDYGSELYRATVTCKAGTMPPISFDKWTSAAARFPIEDVSIQADAERGPMIQLKIIDSETRPANMPILGAERAAEFGLLDNRPGPNFGQYIPMIRGGTVAEPRATDVRRVTNRLGQLQHQPRIDTRRELTIKSIETLFDVPITVPLIGNSQWPGDHLFELFQMHAAPEELLAGLPLGREEHIALGLSKLPTAKVGTYPSIKPNVGDSVWSYSAEIVLKHCFGFHLRRDPIRGIALERERFRQTGFAYSTSLRERDLMSVQRELNVWQDIAEYVTDCTFTGAFNPGIGRRYSARHIIHEATKAGSAFYVGRHRPYFGKADNALESDVKCLLAVRQFLQMAGLPPWFASWKAWFEPELREGDILTLDGIRFVLVNIDAPGFSKSAEQKGTLTGRLMDDVQIWGTL